MKKIIAIISLIIFLLLCSFICIKNEDSERVSILLNNTSSNTKKGGKVTITVDVDNIDEGKGIDTLIATLVYDANIFETVKKADITAENEWDSPSFREDTGKMIIQRDELMKSDDTIMTINLKVKDTAKSGKTTIRLSEINYSDGVENYFPEDNQINILIK